MQGLRSLAVTTALVLGLAGAAWATQGGEGNNTGCNGQGNPNSPCVGGQGGAGGAGGAGGSATSSSSSTSVSVSGSSSVSGASATGGSASASASGEYTGGSYIGGNQSVKVETPHQAPAVLAPALTSAGTGVCLGSVSIGLSGPMAGASFGITKVDKGCEQRSAAALLYQMGYKDAAVRLLMKNDDVREAMGADAPVVKTSAIPRPMPPVYQDETKPMTWVIAPNSVQSN